MQPGFFLAVNCPFLGEDQYELVLAISSGCPLGVSYKEIPGCRGIGAIDRIIWFFMQCGKCQ